MPTFARNLAILVFESAREIPLTVIFPFWNGSSALAVFINVDFPEPDGPQTTTTSPCSTAREQSRSTENAPYHLDTFSMLIMDEDRQSVGSGMSVYVRVSIGGSGRL